MKRLDRLCTRLLRLLEMDEIWVFGFPEVVLLRLLLALHTEVEDLLKCGRRFMRFNLFRLVDEARHVDQGAHIVGTR